MFGGQLARDRTASLSLAFQLEVCDQEGGKPL